ncbi:hypothetical protein OH458_21240 [Vibrio sp. MarTm2]|uniref:hypothetical protein n=1 Tax=Vibrio sp. MarTm2 TaxID=2998831 RepID=UPI0022CD3AF1|nr:hypothetical protein [Vibrio sp. MarTm2]MDA0130592.1 hypothetical protein [Vibrio sp. MarTm2]
MDYLPKLLAKKFGYFSELSIFRIWGIVFGLMLSLSLITPLVASLSELLIAPMFSVFMLFVVGVMSAKFYARKAVIFTDPLAVKVAASSAGKELSKVSKTLVEIVFSLFVYFMLFGCIFLALSPLLILAYT